MRSRSTVLALAAALTMLVTGAPTVASAATEPSQRLVAHLHPGMAPAALMGTARELALTERGQVPALGQVVYEVPVTRAEVAQRRLAASPAVAYVEVDVRLHATLLEIIPDDPLFEFQWGLRRVDAPAAWTHTTGGNDVVIAVLDTGVDASHSDLGTLVAGRDIVNGDDDPDDDHGHGTLVAGVAAARTDNLLGVAGACWTCAVMPVKVLGSDGGGWSSDIAAGVVWATDNGANVINMSLGGPNPSRAMRDAVAYAHAADVVLVAAADNDGTTEATYPSAYAEVLGVAATDPDDQRYPWPNHGDWVDLAAPGRNPSTAMGGTYDWFTGTSSAAPLVAGVVGLARALDPESSTGDITTALTTTAVDVGTFIAHGRVDAAAALTSLAAAEPLQEPSKEIDETTTTSPAPSGDGETSDPVDVPEEIEDPELGDDGGGEADPDEADELTVTRIAGTDRFDTAARASASTFSPGVERVYVATGGACPDALAAGAVAGALGGPVLLTGTDSLPAPTAEELRRLKPREVVVAGGPSAVSNQTLAAIAAVVEAPVRRVAGLDRFDTAARLALDAFASGVPVAYVATGSAFADALAGVPAAIAGGGPVLLVTRDGLPAATASALETLRPERIVVLGGDSAIGAPVVDQLQAHTADLVRLAGADRFATAARVSAYAFNAATAVHLATGSEFPDALAGGPLAGAAAGPLLLVARDVLPAASAEELGRLGAHQLVILGGTSAVSAQVEAAALVAVGG